MWLLTPKPAPVRFAVAALCVVAVACGDGARSEASGRAEGEVFTESQGARGPGTGEQRAGAGRARDGGMAPPLSPVVGDGGPLAPPAQMLMDAGTPSSGDGGGDNAGRVADAGTTEAARPLPTVSAPERLGTLLGPGASPSPAGVRADGADLGVTYEHDGQLFMLFGDTSRDAGSMCNSPQTNDDAIATLPSSLPTDIPQPSFIKAAGSLDFSPVQLLRGATSLSLGFGQVPLAGFSDGVRGLALFRRVAPIPCDAAGACPFGEHFACSDDVGVCEPALSARAVVCERATGAGCLPSQQCDAVSLCIDTQSPQQDGSIAGDLASVVQEVELAAQRPASPEVFDSVLTWPTNRFNNLAARTVAHVSGTASGNDYRSGYGELLLWGRPGLAGQHGREARLYLLRHPLPLSVDDAGAAVFQPVYFAGVDPLSGEPNWSELESDAVPLALDGELAGDPHEERQVTGTMTVSWLGSPIDKWVMLYGGDVSNPLLHGGMHARQRSAGIMMRFAEHPWGPWSPPVPHLVPGLPNRAGDLYGPGGYLYHTECRDQEELLCVDRYPSGPSVTTPAACGAPVPQTGPGRLHGVNVIDAYTGPKGQAGFEMLWTVSTWNPYSIQLMKTRMAPANVPVLPGDEIASARALQRMGDWRSLPLLPAAPGKYVQQTSRDRGTQDTSFPLSNNGNRDFNNFICASADARMGALQIAPFRFDLPACEDGYVRGLVLGRFEGSGRLARMWIGMASLMFGPADQEILRIYVDDDPSPRVEVLLADALDGSAGEIFAPPFGAGSPTRLAWYYPVAFDRKLVVSLDGLGELDEYYYHCDAVLDAAAGPPEPRPSDRLPERDRAIAQLTAVHHPAGDTGLLGRREAISLAAGAEQTLRRAGPATIQEVRVRVHTDGLSSLARVNLAVRWDGAAEPAIDLPLLELLAAEGAPPERSTLALSSFVEMNERTFVIRLPMPFASEAEWSFHNTGVDEAAFELALSGDSGVPGADFGYLHVQRGEAAGTGEPYYVAARITGRGRLVGLCGRVEGIPDMAGGIQYDPLNLLEGDIQVLVDGQLALDGTGTEEYADDVFYFADAPHSSPFVQAWGVVQDARAAPPGQANFCRWHVLGTELDFESALEVRFELGGAGNPGIVSGHRVIAFYYLAD